MKNYKWVIIAAITVVSTLISATIISGNPFSSEEANISDISINALSEEKTIVDPIQEFDEYKAQWREIDSLQRDGLYKSVNEKIEALITKAKQEENHPMIIKAYLYKIKTDSYIEEDNFKKSVKDLEELTQNSTAPTRQIAHYILSKVYWGYYNANSWNISRRTELDDYDTTDMATWPKSAFVKKTMNHSYASISQPDLLKQMPVQNLSLILTEFEHYYAELDNETPYERRPTVFDLLARNAFSFFKSVNFNLPRGAQEFAIDQEAYFGTSEEFNAIKLPTYDSINPDFHAVRILQQLTRFHLANNNEDALLDLTLTRLNYINQNSVLANKAELFYAAIDKMIATYPNNSIIGEYIHIKAKHLSNQANLPVRESEEESHQFDKVKALELCAQVIKKFPNTIGSGRCKHLAQAIHSKSISLSTETYVIPNYPIRYNLSGRNVHEVFTKLIPFDYDDYYDKYSNYKFKKKLLEKIKKSEAIYENHDKLPDSKDYLSHSFEFGLPQLKKGFYLLVTSTSPEFVEDEENVQIAPIIVTDLALNVRSVNNGAYEFLVNNRTTGLPLEGARIKIWSEKWNYSQRKYVTISHGTISTDSQGKSIFKTSSDRRNFSYSVSYKDDKIPNDQSFYLYSSYKQAPQNRTELFIDRGIYRPGQKVYFKGIKIHHNGDKKTLVKNEKATITLYDANYEMVKELPVQTNEFGSYSGSFELPMGRMNGQFRIQEGNSTKYFRVEEYKRPKFETEFKTVEGQFKINDSVLVKGFAKAYAGNMIDGAKVKYTVTRTTSYPSWGYRCWGWFPTSPAVTITTGETVSDDDGVYNINFKAIPDPSVNQKYTPTFNYTVTATVTDVNGETHSASSNVRVGYHSMNLSVSLSDSYQISDIDSLSISASNLNYGKLKVKGNYTISKLEIPSQPKRSPVLGNAVHRKWTKEAFEDKFPLDEYEKTTQNDWEIVKKVAKTYFVSGERQALALREWGVGTYKIEALAKDKDGNEVKDIRFFTITDPSSKKVASNESLFAKRLNPLENEPGDIAEFLVGSNHPSYNFLMEIEVAGKETNQTKIISSAWYKNQSGQQIIKVPITEAHRNGIAIHFNLYKNARNKHVTKYIYVSQKHRQLKAKFTTFRDKLLPGQQEKWTIHLESGYGEKVAAEMLATMYDKSLDEFASNYFSLNTGSSFYSRRTWSTKLSHTTASIKTISNDFNPYNYSPSFSYPALRLFGADNFLRGRGTYRYKSRGGEGAVMMDQISTKKVASYKNKESGKDSYSIVAEESAEEDNRNDDSPAPAAPPVAGKREEISELEVRDPNSVATTSAGLDKVKARTNFSETAFFFPHLKTNENGDILIEFTIPESLTKWKFMSISHTEDLKVATLNEEIVTQKELMVVPNAPRFFREGDKITLSSKISNLTEKLLPIQAKLTLIDPFTEEDITSYFEVDNQIKQTEVGGNKSTSVSWELNIPERISAVAYKIVAAGGEHTDGERATLPILSNRMLVTESMPMSVRKAGTHNFTFEKLAKNKSKTLKHHNLTLEFTENPAWYAIQAMPYMMEYPYECAEQTFTRYYSNAIATHIMNSSPKIKEVIDSWKNESPEAFLSNLEKNQELKSLLLEETPWVMDAKNETQRKKNIALLFDMARMERESSKALNKIQLKQRHNGGWSWFKGMPENRYITQHIISGLGHLKQLKVTHNESRIVEKMTKKGIEFLDGKIVDDYNWMKRHYPDWEKKNMLSQTQIQYLYTRSYFTDVEMSKKTKVAFDYYFNSAKKRWLEQSLYTQGMISLAMHRFGEPEKALAITKSLKQRSILNKEFGRYWKELNNGGYYWYQAPIETQALMIELFDEVAKDDEMVEDLKVWLLKQKQTTDWKTTKATAEACYALLLRGTDVLTQTNTLGIFLGNKKLVYNQLASSPNEIGVKTQAGTGYFKHRFNQEEIDESYGNVKIEKKTNTVSWGSMYWQYWEDIDKITFHKTPLHLEKELFIVENNGQGDKMTKISKKDVKVGDKIRVRIVLRSDRNMEFVHMKDMRASGFEPVNVLSTYKYKDGLGYYESTKDASTNFFFDYIPKGTYVFEYDLRVAHKGDFSNGIATIQCMYAPEFTSHSDGIRVTVK